MAARPLCRRSLQRPRPITIRDVDLFLFEGSPDFGCEFVEQQPNRLIIHIGGIERQHLRSPRCRAGSEGRNCEPDGDRFGRVCMRFRRCATRPVFSPRVARPHSAAPCCRWGVTPTGTHRFPWRTSGACRRGRHSLLSDKAPRSMAVDKAAASR